MDDQPRIWLRFEHKKDDRVMRFKIQDTPKEMHEDLMRFMVDYFMRDETLNRTFEIQNDELAIREFCELQSSYLSQNMALICLVDDDKQYDMIKRRPQILGFSLMMIVKKNFPHFPKVVKSPAMMKLFQVFDEMDKVDDAFARFHVDEFMGDAGLSVHPDYRGMNIATELLKARSMLCKEAGLKVTAAAFTSNISQRTAEKSGYVTYQQVPYSKIEEITCTKFATPTKYIKLMACVIK